MKKINSKKLREAIRLEKKYYRTSDRDIIPALLKAEKEVFSGDYYWASSLISAVTCKKYDYSEPYETYAKVLEALGFEIVDETEIDSKKGQEK